MISRKGVVTDEMSLLPTHRHEGKQTLERLMKVIVFAVAANVSIVAVALLPMKL